MLTTAANRLKGDTIPRRPLWSQPSSGRASRPCEGRSGPPNKRMKLTKLSAAPWLGRRCHLVPAPSRMDAGTASQLIRSVRQT
jgi:hypothetical protein